MLSFEMSHMEAELNEGRRMEEVSEWRRSEATGLEGACSAFC